MSKNNNDLLTNLIESLKGLLPKQPTGTGIKVGPITATAGYNPQNRAAGAGLGVNGVGPNIYIGPEGLNAGIGNPDDNRSYGQQFKDATDRWNPITQVQSVLGMNPQMAQSYRQQVDKTVPRADFGNAPVLSGLAEGIANAIPNAVAGAARLPAARTLGQGAGDVFDVGVGALQGAGLVDAGKAGLSALARNPDWLTNQRGGMDLSYNYSPEGNLQSVKPKPQLTLEQLTEKASGWNPGDRVKFDTALLTNDTKTLKALLPRVPEEYLKNRFGPQLYDLLLKGLK